MTKQELSCQRLSCHQCCGGASDTAVTENNTKIESVQNRFAMRAVN